MRFRIPRSILRAAIAANVFVSASAVCYSSIPGNRNNSYQPNGLVDVAEASGLATYHRLDRLPNFVLYSPSNLVTRESPPHTAVSTMAEESSETIREVDGECEINQDFEGCWMTCPEEIGSTICTDPQPAAQNQKQTDYVEQVQVISWAKGGAEFIADSVKIGKNFAIEAPFDYGSAVAQFFGMAQDSDISSSVHKGAGNVFVYVIEQVDAPENNFDLNESNEIVESTMPTFGPVVNPFQSGIQDLMVEIHSAIETKSMGCGFDPYESCFPDEIASSVAVDSAENLPATRIVSEDDFIPFSVKIRYDQLASSVATNRDAGIGHCAIPTSVERSVEFAWEDSTVGDSDLGVVDRNASNSLGSASGDRFSRMKDQLQPAWVAARSQVVSWFEQGWDEKKWEFVTRSLEMSSAVQRKGYHRSPKFRWDAVYGQIDAPMLSEIPIDPSLTLVQDMYPQPNWYGVARGHGISDGLGSGSQDAIPTSADQVAEADLIEPKQDGRGLGADSRALIAAIGRVAATGYNNSVRLWERLTSDSRRLVAAQLKQAGSLLLRSADSLEGTVGLAKRNVNDGNR